MFYANDSDNPAEDLGHHFVTSGIELDACSQQG